mmetsp:Transcript_4711/g.7299  ORF Transcript_4711/g.7299 Transcript_4711/m.7299 type:complete len:86 (+) Transcript_4711:65-322(+)
MADRSPTSSKDVQVTPERQAKKNAGETTTLATQSTSAGSAPSFDAATLDLVLGQLDFRALSPERNAASNALQQLFQYWDVTTWTI